MKTTEQKIKQEKHDAEYALKKLGLVETRLAGWVYEDSLDSAEKNGYIKKEKHRGQMYPGFTMKAQRVGFNYIINCLHVSKFNFRKLNNVN